MGKSKGKQRQNSEAKPRGRVENIAAHKWPKGHCGNPKGRPAGESLTTKIRRVLDEPDADHGTKANRLIAMAVQYADGGDFRYFKEIMDRMDGKVPDRIADAEGKKLTLLPIKLDGDKEV